MKILVIEDEKIVLLVTATNGEVTKTIEIQFTVFKSVKTNEVLLSIAETAVT